MPCLHGNLSIILTQGIWQPVAIIKIKFDWTRLMPLTADMKSVPTTEISEDIQVAFRLLTLVITIRSSAKVCWLLCQWASLFKNVYIAGVCAFFGGTMLIFDANPIMTVLWLPFALNPTEPHQILGPAFPPWFYLRTCAHGHVRMQAIIE